MWNKCSLLYAPGSMTVFFSYGYSFQLTINQRFARTFVDL
jgi:hypothetical protein